MNSSTDSKLDSILAKLGNIETLLSQKPADTDEALKKEFRDYMLEHFNISWLDDNIEGDIYDSIFSFVQELLNRLP